MPCQSCQNPTLCTDRCQVYAEQLRACEESGQMTAQEVSAHVEAGEMPDDLSQKQDEFCDAHCTWRDHHPDCVRARSGEAGEMEAAKGDYGD